MLGRSAGKTERANTEWYLRYPPYQPGLYPLSGRAAQRELRRRGRVAGRQVVQRGRYSLGGTGFPCDYHCVEASFFRFKTGPADHTHRRHHIEASLPQQRCRLEVELRQPPYVVGRLFVGVGTDQRTDRVLYFGIITNQFNAILFHLS